MSVRVAGTPEPHPVGPRVRAVPDHATRRVDVGRNTGGGGAPSHKH